MEATDTPVKGVRAVGPDAVALDIATPPGFDALPGQFVKLSLNVEDEHRSRFYTLSSPAVGETFEVTVGIEPDGDMGPYLAALDPGEVVEIAGPFGNAYYEDEPSITILAGGPGVGPAVGLAERALGDGGTANVVYRDGDPLYEDRLDALRAAGAFVAVLGDDEALAPALADALADAPESQVFVYGFADFLDAAIDALQAVGGDPDGAKYENFG